jgi:hypothetical protein
MSMLWSIIIGVFVVSAVGVAHGMFNATVRHVDRYWDSYEE